MEYPTVMNSPRGGRRYSTIIRVENVTAQIVTHTVALFSKFTIFL